MTPLQGVNAQYLLPKFHPASAAESQRQGSMVFNMQNTLALFENGRNAVNRNIDRLKRIYGFPANDSVAIFLANHRAIPAVLFAATQHLKEHFGPDRILNLDVSTDDDDSKTLYVVVVWHNSVETAAKALQDFTENWWLDHMTSSTADLAFTYELA